MTVPMIRVKVVNITAKSLYSKESKGIKMNRSELIKTKCWSCWFREGSHCHSEAFGEVPMDGIYYIGNTITPEHIAKCDDNYMNKRSIFGNSKNVKIMSEGAKK